MAKGVKAVDGFTRQIEQALEQFLHAEPSKIDSLLTSPYFLGPRLKTLMHTKEDKVHRVEALRQLLIEAAKTLTAFHQRVLDLTYFKRDPNKNYIGIAGELNLSSAQYMRRRKEAVEALVDQVARRAPLPLRSETPRGKAILGRASTLASSLVDLRNGHTVALLGPSGIGKTALGVAISEVWDHKNVFWYTIRPSLTDDINGFVFTLSFFLQSLGASNTWRYLAFQEGRLDLPKVLGLLHDDLHLLRKTPPLLCVDEVDLLLQPASRSDLLIALLDDLRQHAPTLLIGQQAFFPIPHRVTLSGLSFDEVRELLNTRGVELENNLIQALHTLSQGNPAFVLVFASLVREGESASDALQLLQSDHTMAALLARMWKRLGDDERILLGYLSSFYGPIPSSAFDQNGPLLEKLISLDLVNQNDTGDVWCANFAQDFIQTLITPDDARVFHLNAASMRESLGDFTSAARHNIEAGRAELAIWTWLKWQSSEINRGQAPTALRIFEKVTENDLANEQDRQALALLRARQFIVAGRGDDAVVALSQVRGAGEPVINILAHELRGRAQQMLENTEQALSEYRSALRMLHNYPEVHKARLHTRVGYTLLWQLGEPNAALYEINQAQFEIEHLRGSIEERMGLLEAAYASYQNALSLAPRLPDTKMAQAIVCQKLGDFLWRNNRADESITYLEKAVALTTELGAFEYRLMGVISLSGARIIAGDYDQAQKDCLKALAEVSELSNPYVQAGLNSNAAEACFHLGRDTEAKQLASTSMQFESPVWIPYALATLGRVAEHQGRLEEGKELLRRALKEAQQMGDSYQATEIERWLDALLDNHSTD